jgi:tetratricopeptide (TPR) repeat protein
MRFALALATLLAAAPLARADQQEADAEAEMKRADAYLQARNYQAAIAHYNAARLLAPERPGPYRALGMAWFASGQCAEAVPMLEEYVRRKPRDPWPEAVRVLSECKQRLAGPEREEKPAGTFRVTSDPPGAQVRIDDPDGAMLGTTPYESTGLATGLHRLYVSAPDYRPAVGEVRIQPGVTASLRVTLAPLRTLSREPAPSPTRLGKLQEYEQSQALEQQIAEQVRLRYEGQKIEVCGSGPRYHFCTQHEQLTENEFVRRYRKLTAAQDLDFAKKVRNKGSIAFWTSLGLAGVALIAYGGATYHKDCPAPMDASVSSCDGDTNTTSEAVLYSGLSVWGISVLGYFAYGGLRFDGSIDEHLINEYDARLYTVRFNRALEAKIHDDLAAGRLSQTDEPEPFTPRRPRRSHVLIVPTLGGVMGQF